MSITDLENYAGLDKRLDANPSNEIRRLREQVDAKDARIAELEAGSTAMAYKPLTGRKINELMIESCVSGSLDETDFARAIESEVIKYYEGFRANARRYSFLRNGEIPLYVFEGEDKTKPLLGKYLDEAVDAERFDIGVYAAPQPTDRNAVIEECVSEILSKGESEIAPAAFFAHALRALKTNAELSGATLAERPTQTPG